MMVFIFEEVDWQKMFWAAKEADSRDWSDWTNWTLLILKFSKSFKCFTISRKFSTVEFEMTDKGIDDDNADVDGALENKFWYEQ